jgi:hypothetical protein
MDVRDELWVIVCDWGVCNALKRRGLSWRVKQKKPKFVPMHIRDRLDFAKMCHNWILSDWESVTFFLDESQIDCFNFDRRSWWWICYVISEHGLSSTICHYELDPRHLILQENNASNCSTQALREWFRNQPFNLLTWPTQSHDLNPIEHL